MVVPFESVALPVGRRLILVLREDGLLDVYGDDDLTRIEALGMLEEAKRNLPDAKVADRKASEGILGVSGDSEPDDAADAGDTEGAESLTLESLAG